MQRRAGTGTGVLHIDNGNAFHTHGAQRELPAHHVLAFHVALRGIGEISRLQLPGATARILQRGGDGLAREVFHAPLRVPAKRRHANAGDIDRFHGMLPEYL